MPSTADQTDGGDSGDETGRVAPGRRRPNKIPWGKIALLLAVLAAAVLLYRQFGDVLRLSALAEKEEALRSYRAAHPLFLAGIAFLLYVGVTALSLPLASALTLVIGWLFGFWQALLIVSFASTAGATLAFLFSRYLFRDAIQRKFGGRIEAFNGALEREGGFYLFTLRLVPVVPFFVINLVMGLTPLRAWTFWWVSQLGMLAGTAVYVFAGASVPELATLAEEGVKGILSPQLIAAFVALGVFPLAVRKIMAKLKKSPAAAT